MIVRQLEILSKSRDHNNSKFALDVNKDQTAMAIQSLSDAADILGHTNLVFSKSCVEDLHRIISLIESSLRKMGSGKYHTSLSYIVNAQDELSEIASMFARVLQESEGQKDVVITKMAESIIQINNDLYDELLAFGQIDEDVAKLINDYHLGKHELGD